MASSGAGRGIVEEARSNSGRPWLAAFDTATDQAGLALFDGEQMLELSWPGGRQQTTSVLPAFDGLLTRHGIDIDSVGAVAVAAGPGSFTGLRVGLSLAKGLAISGNRVLVGVSTLDIAAAPYLEAGLDCLVLVPAGRGRVVWAAYGPQAPPPAPVNISFEEFLVVLRSHASAIVAGELTLEQRARIEEVHGRVTLMMARRRPGVLAQIGLARWQAGEVDEPAMLEPLYLHGLPNPR